MHLAVACEDGDPAAWARAVRAAYIAACRGSRPVRGTLTLARGYGGVNVTWKGETWHLVCEGTAVPDPRP